MKRIVPCCLIVIMLLLFGACGGNNTVSESTGAPVASGQTYDQTSDQTSEETNHYSKNKNGYYALTKSQFVAMCRVVEVTAENWWEYYGDSEPITVTDANGTEQTTQGVGRLSFPENTICLNFGDQYLKLSNVKCFYAWGSEEHELMDLTIPQNAIASKWDNTSYFYSICEAEFVSSDIYLLLIDIPDELWTIDDEGNRHLMVEDYFDLGDDEGVRLGVLGLYVNDLWEYVEKEDNPIHIYYRSLYPN